MVVIVLQRIALQFFLDALYFPLWWYTGGLRRVLVGLFHSLQDANISLAPGLWVRHIFTPMYGQTDFEGRLMSVFMRIVNIIGRTFALFVWLWVLCIALCLWLATPVFLIYMIGRVFLLQ